MEKHLPISTDDARNSVRVTGGAVREAAATGVVQAFAGVRQMPRNPARSDALQEMDSEKSATFRLCRSPAEAPGTPGVPLQLTFCRQRMRALLDAHDIAFRDRIYAMFEQHADLFTPRYGLTVPEERELVMARWAVIREAQLLKGTLNRWLQDIEDARMLGCFALTELGHGSNVRGIETLATYDPGRGEFIIHTPTETAQKYWIGGAAETARWAVVFAKLLTPDGVHRGIHPFLVRLRTDAGEVCHGITIADVGVKQGLNGVDNGRIWFDNVRIPREQMLARYSQVLPDGSYRSSFKTGDEQFAAQLAALTGGRVSISVGAVNRMKTGLCIAIRYALSRRAFAPSGDDEEADATANETHDGKTAPEEMLLMDYQSHQMRLLPMLATTYVLALATNRLKYRWHHRLEDPNPKEIHLWSSGLKAFATWTMSDVLQECRESCGGMGYLAENRIGVLKCDFDVYLTYEGTNIVLVQQVARAQLAAYAAGKLPPPPAVPTITSDRELAEPAFITASLARLHDALVRRLAERLTYATKQNSMKPFFAWNKMCLDLAIDVGKVYTCLLAYRIACDEVRQIDDPALKQILGYCCALYGLHMPP
jgi:acyl-CoA oxidase